MAGECEESDVLFSHAIQNANRADLVASQPDNHPSRPAQLSLQRLYLRRRSVKALLKQLLKNVHNLIFTSTATTQDNIEDSIPRTQISPTERLDNLACPSLS